MKLRQPTSAILGLALDGHRLEAVSVKRTNGSVRIQGNTAASLELNLLTDDPELVGREIRNHLDRAGLKERACAVCLPLDWALTLHVPVPELPPEDVESFLNIEAERGFPFGQDMLATMTSRCRGSNGAQFATLIAIPKENLFTLQKVLKAAQLRPLTFSLGMPALLDAGESEGVAGVRVGENSVELEVTCGGGIAALRPLQGALEQDGVRKKPYADVVARELRITLGQLPPELRETVHRLKLFGTNEDLGRFAEELQARTKLMGLQLELVPSYSEKDFGVRVPNEAIVAPALSLALRTLTGRGTGLEFLPPKVSAWKQLTQRYSSAKLVWTGAAAGAIILLVAGLFIYQQWQLNRWTTRWSAIKRPVTDLDTMQQQIRRYRPWFDDSFKCMSILRRVTEAFPEDGSVYAKTVEIRDPGLITCSGTARDQQALSRVYDQLRAMKEITSVQYDSIRGKQFTLNIHWGEGAPQ